MEFCRNTVIVRTPVAPMRGFKNVKIFKFKRRKKHTRIADTRIIELKTIMERVKENEVEVEVASMHLSRFIKRLSLPLCITCALFRSLPQTTHTPLSSPNNVISTKSLGLEDN